MNPQEHWDIDGIDELLSAFIDGELSGREQTEVHRLIAHDARIAERLYRLEACRSLVGSLPPAEAPAELTELIMAGVRKAGTVPARRTGGDGRIGVVHLYARRMAAAAAMIAMAGILAAVVYQIISPVHPEGPIAQDNQPRLAAPTAAVQPEAGAAARAGTDVFEGRLILTTRDVVAAEAFVKKAIETSGIVRQDVMKDAKTGGTYFVSCSRERLSSLLGDLETIWSRFDSATLVVAGQGGGEAVVIEGVNVSQIERIAQADAVDVRYRLAKEFATVNAVEEMMPARGFLVATESGESGLLSIPRPVLTGGEETSKQPAEQGGPVQLTIIVAGTQTPR